MLPKRIVFCGGGTRCLVFLQGLVDLENKGMLRNVNEYWGTSAGAMIASLYALTKSGSRVKEIMFAADYKKFRDIDVTNLLGIQQTWGLDNGTSLVQEIERIFESVEPGAKSKSLAEIPTLNIVVSDITLHETIVCNAKTFPTLRIVDALRASMSLPVFFRPFRHPESGNLWVDGAIKANFPWHCLPNDKARSEALGFTFEKPYMHKTPKTFMEYIFSMIHFDEPKKISNLRQWPNIIWFTQPPYPSWFIRLQKEDFEMVEQFGKEGVEKWIITQLNHNPSAAVSNSVNLYSHSTMPSSKTPSSVHHILQSYCQKDCINELSDTLTQDLPGCSHEVVSTHHHPSPLFPQTQTQYKKLIYRRWSV